jgi:hypothetical protein
MGRSFAFSKQSGSWKIMLELMIGNNICEVAAFMYVILSKAENQVPYVELIGIMEHLTL